jgi:hypothetical protein
MCYNTGALNTEVKRMNAKVRKTHGTNDGSSRLIKEHDDAKGNETAGMVVKVGSAIADTLSPN